MSEMKFKFISQAKTKGEENLNKVIGQFIAQCSIWGFIFGRLSRKEMPGFGTFGVAPGKRGQLFLIFDPDILEKTTRKSLYYVIMHEGMHLVNNHIPRQLRLMNEKEVATDEDAKNIEKFMKSQVFNIAADCAVNEQAGIPEKIQLGDQEVPAQFPSMHNLEPDHPTEYYYYKLLEQSPDPNELKQQLLDAHNWCSEGDEKGEGSGSEDGDEESEGGKSEAEKAKEREKLARNVENQTRKVVGKAYEDVKRARGTISGDIVQKLEDLLGSSKIPYYQMIARLVQGSRLSKYKRAHNRTNKKRTHLFTNRGDYPILPFPGKTRDYSFKIGMLIDTSGSQSPKDIAEALSGIKKIIEEDPYSTVTVLENDTKVNKEYTAKKVADIDPEISGRGGTILEPGLTRMRDLHCDVNLVFTDGHCDNINAMDKNILPRKRIIWVISPHGAEEMINKTGNVIWVEREDDY